jgi:hypothetical protein
MPAPTVTRPTAATTSVADTPAPGTAGISNDEWAKYAVWGVMGLAAIAVLAFAFTGIVTYTESAHAKKLRGEWDEYHNAINNQKTEEDRIEALEKLADNPKIQGTAVHAYALMQLGRMNFEIALSPRKQPETRGAAIVRAAKLYELLAMTEPFKSNPAFGPSALQDLACAYEQQQITETETTKYYDEAIKALRGAMYTGDSKDPEPVKFYQTHFLFDKMNAELGRLYWLRAQRELELDPAKNAAAAKSDREFALVFVKKALEAGVTSVEKDRYEANFKGAWREEAAYIKSLLDADGKMMPDGKAPEMKVDVPAPKTGDAAPAGNGPSDANARATELTPKPAVVKVPAPDTKDAKKTDDAKKPDDTKKDEPKKTGSASLRSESIETTSSEFGGSSQHLTYSQIQAMLKQGRSAMCQCPRCAGSDKAIGAKLAE